MAEVIIIVAVAKNNVIGRDGTLPWHLPADFQWFKRQTMGKPVVMGRNTFETVRGFGGDWPYSKPVFVLSNSMKSIPEGYEGKAEPVKGSLSEVIKAIHQKGYKDLYIDGGVTVQNFLKEDMIDEMIITVIPILLGGGIPLFGELPEPMAFEHVKTEVYLNAIVQNHYCRKK